jgi:hypothetical protein
VFEVKGWNPKVAVDPDQPSATTLEVNADIGSFSIVDFVATVSGELTIAGTTRPADMALTVDRDRIRGTMTVVQSRWGIKPFTALMGALRVRDAVDIVVDVRLPGRPA